jgi:hypothetical protein
MDVSEPDTGLSRPEVHELLVSWLTTTPDLSFARARKDAERIGLRVTPRLFAEAKKAMGLPAGPPRTTTRKEGSNMTGTVRARTPLMTFVIEQLQAAPNASFQEVRDAAEKAGFKVAPVVYGKARNLLGLGPGPTARRRRPVMPESSEGMDLDLFGPAPRSRRRSKTLNLDSLGNLVGELQNVIAERDRAMRALEDIARVLRRIFPPEAPPPPPPPQ